jgi:hypothetical protein
MNEKLLLCWVSVEIYRESLGVSEWEENEKQMRRVVVCSWGGCGMLALGASTIRGIIAPPRAADVCCDSSIAVDTAHSN